MQKLIETFKAVWNEATRELSQDEKREIYEGGF